MISIVSFGNKRIEISMANFEDLRLEGKVLGLAGEHLLQ
jgi:hypothetical protein